MQEKNLRINDFGLEDALEHAQVSAKFYPGLSKVFKLGKGKDYEKNDPQRRDRSGSVNGDSSAKPSEHDNLHGIGYQRQ